MLTKIKLAITAVAMIALLPATEAFARKPLLLFPAGGPATNQPSIERRMGNQQVDPTVSGIWMPLASAFPGTSPDTALMLTDGSVVMHDLCTSYWYRLIPDLFGSYINGSWTGALAPMIGSGTAPDGYGPLFYASAVLPDGRLIVNGGEYEFSNPAPNACNAAVNSSVDSTKGSLYNPYSNTWSAVQAPLGWNTIGDASSVLLGVNNINGYAAVSYMLSNCCQGSLAAIATIQPLPGTGVTWTPLSANLNGNNDEEGWILLATGQVLTVDTVPAAGTLAELFNPATRLWSAAGNTPVSLIATDPPEEMGPGVSIGYNMAVQFGGNGHNAVFVYPNNWIAGPSFPSPQEVADGPAALLPNGNILVQSSISYNDNLCGGCPSLFWEFSTSGMTPQTPIPAVGALSPVNSPPCAANVGSFQGRMLVLPTGQILWDAGEGGFNCTSVYVPNAGDGSPNPVMRPPPQITSISTPALSRGSTYTLSGSMFRGVSQGATYGDDAQMATNYPLVRITNNATGHVCWGRTHDWAYQISTQFDVPPATTPTANWALVENPCDPGASTLVVITNGLVSNPIAVAIN